MSSTLPDFLRETQSAVKTQMREGALYLVYAPARPLAPKLAAFRDFVVEHAPRLLAPPA